MATVYIETSVVSHATARASADPVVAALQAQAREWWQAQRPKFDLVTSQLVLREAAAIQQLLPIACNCCKACPWLPLT